MKNFIKILIVNLILTTLTAGTLVAGNQLKPPSPAMNDLIVGTWLSGKFDSTYDIVQASPGNIFRFEFLDNGEAEIYHNNELTRKFTWYIVEEATPSGLTAHSLILTEIQGNLAGTVWEYELDTLTENRMVYVWYGGMSADRHYFVKE